MKNEKIIRILYHFLNELRLDHIFFDDRVVEFVANNGNLKGVVI